MTLPSEMTAADAVTQARLLVSRLNQAIWVQRALHVAVSRGVFETMGHGPVELGDLARATGTDPSALRRVLRLLAAEGLMHSLGEDRFRLLPLGESMLAEGAGSARWLMMDNAVFEAAAAVDHSVSTGEAAFPVVHGRGFWEHLAQNGESAAAFTQKMRTQALMLCLPPALACDWRDGETVVDIGAGDGTLLGGILTAHPTLHGVAVDRPPSSTPTARLLRSLGLAGRCSVRSADFFTDPIPLGDTLLLSRVLHDWDDQAAHDLLCRLRAGARPPRGRLIVLEMLRPEDDSPHPALVGDVNLLVLFGGARERTLEEFRALFAAAGFELATHVTAAASPVVALIAHPR